MSETVVRDATADDIPVLVRGRVRMFEDMAANDGTVLDPALAERLRRSSSTLRKRT